MARLTLSERIEALASVPVYVAYLSQPPPVGYGPYWLETVRGMTQADQKTVLAFLKSEVPSPPPPAPAPRKKRDFAAHKYEQYDPKIEAPGNPAEWRRAFEERMGEAKAVLGGRGPRAVLGVSSKATWAEIKSAYRKLALIHHPDRVPAAEQAGAAVRFREITAAYTLLAGETGH